MKYLFFAGILSFSSYAFAVSECAGRTSDGSFVTVQIDTKGSVAVSDGGTVTIEREGNKFGYRFTHDETSQYFEYDDAANASAMVGAVAYVKKEFPVTVKYVGTNFVDMDLKTIVDGGKIDAKGNFLRVWKGPGHAATDQYQLTKVACSVWAAL